MKLLSVNEDEMCFRCYAFRAFFLAEKAVRCNIFAERTPYRRPGSHVKVSKIMNSYVHSVQSYRASAAIFPLRNFC